eukprot:1147564-Pelagomonas_calceolata.AAC.1
MEIKFGFLLQLIWHSFHNPGLRPSPVLNYATKLDSPQSWEAYDGLMSIGNDVSPNSKTTACSVVLKLYKGQHVTGCCKKEREAKLAEETLFA